MSEAKFFKTPDSFRAWLANNHDKVGVQWVGYYKVATGRASVTWEESVEEALCFGWIDGLRKKIDDEAYKVRFTSRRPASKWSAKNIASVERLIVEERMAAAGLRAWKSRKGTEAGYSYKQRDAARLAPAHEKIFKQNKAAWKHFQQQAPWYRSTATYWVVSAKKAETRQRRLQKLIDASAQEQPVGPLKRPAR